MELMRQHLLQKRVQRALGAPHPSKTANFCASICRATTANSRRNRAPGHQRRTLRVGRQLVVLVLVLRLVLGQRGGHGQEAKHSGGSGAKHWLSLQKKTRFFFFQIAFEC